VNGELAIKALRGPEAQLWMQPLLNQGAQPLLAGEQSLTDSEAGWTRKRGRYTYGYKAHISTTKNGLIRKAKVTSADIHDSLVFCQLL
jgi:IS5 family transposase